MKNISHFLLLIIFSIIMVSCKSLDTKIEKKSNFQRHAVKKGEVEILNASLIANKEFEIGQDISLIFNEKMDSSTFTNETVKLVRSDTYEKIEIEMEYNYPILIIHPIDRFEIKDKKVVLNGIKPDTRYTIYLKTSKIKDLSGEILSLNYDEISFETEKLNYGIYWFGKDGKCQKYVNGVPNRYYDPKKSVLIHSHGWQPSRTSDDYWMDQPYVVKTDYYENISANSWIEKGYNIGAWFWGQFADEIDVREAESKIWTADNMRYITKNRKYLEFSKEKNIHELFYDNYIGALRNFVGKEIRLTGHSLGNQVITALTNKLKNEVEIGNIDRKYLPARLTLLDPFWTIMKREYLNNQSTADVTTKIIKNLITTEGIVVEEVKSSEIGNTFFGDSNFELRKLTSFYRIFPNFIRILDLEAKHVYATDWYFWSIKYDLDVDQGKIGANITTEDVRDSMNYFNKNSRFWISTRGGFTPDPKDDYLKEIPGIFTF